MNEWNNADDPDVWTAVNAYRNQRDALQGQLDQAKRQLDALALPGRLVGALYALVRGEIDEQTVRLSSLVGEALDIDPDRVRVTLGHRGRTALVLDITADVHERLAAALERIDVALERDPR